MNKKLLKRILLIIMFTFAIYLFANHVDAAYISISLNKTTASPGETITGTISSDCVGRVNLSSSNGTISTDRVWIEGSSQSFTITVGSSGTASISASAENGVMSSNGTDVSVGGASAVISISSSSPSSGGSTSGNASTGNSSGTSTTTEKSSNANLSNLGIRPNDFTGFRPATTTYNVTVPEDVESVEVYATAADSKARVSGTGTKTLQKGANALNVTVTAEDGTTKTYTINVTREGEGEEEQTEENTEEPAEVKNGLSSIKIANLELNPSFSTDVYEYTVKYIGEDTSLDIQAVATDPSYTVEILGNEELKEGDNTITILVTDAEGNNVATYQVTVNKSLVDEEALAKEEEEKQKEEQRKILLIAGGVAIIILIIVIVIIIKRRRNRAYAEEFSGVPFAGMNEEEDYYNDYDYTNEDYDDYYDNDNNFNDYNDQEIQGNDNSLLEENNDDSQIQEETKKVNSADTEDNNEQELDEKERAKREFLNGYNSDDEDYFEDEKTRRGRKRGKRFK